MLDLRKVVHRAVHNVGGEIEGLRFNRAVAQIYELSNAIAKFSHRSPAACSPAQRDALREAVERLVQLVAPMMPHLAETCWAALGKTGLVVDAGWPVARSDAAGRSRPSSSPSRSTASAAARSPSRSAPPKDWSRKRSCLSKRLPACWKASRPRRW